jgi:hypothetical protein
MKKIMALVLAAMMLMGICSALAEAPEGYPEVKEGIDFGGKDVYIYDYWSAQDYWDSYPAEPTEQEEATHAYREWIQNTYNVKVHQIQRGDWGTCAEEMTNFNTTPEDDKLAIFIIEPGKVGPLVANGIAAPLDYDFSAEKWNKADLDLGPRAASTTACTPANPSPVSACTSTSACWKKLASNGKRSTTCRKTAPGPGLLSKTC